MLHRRWSTTLLLLYPYPGISDPVHAVSMLSPPRIMLRSHHYKDTGSNITTTQRSLKVVHHHSWKHAEPTVISLLLLAFLLINFRLSSSRTAPLSQPVCLWLSAKQTTEYLACKTTRCFLLARTLMRRLIHRPSCPAYPLATRGQSMKPSSRQAQNGRVWLNQWHHLETARPRCVETRYMD